MKHTITYLCSALLALAVPASAQAYSDNFDTYTNGQILNGVNGWKGWDNVAAAAGIVSNARRFSLPNSMQCSNGVDAIRPVTGVTSGKWFLTLKQRVASGDLTNGNVYVIGNNDYNDGGPYVWSIQVAALPGGLVNDDLRPGNFLPLGVDRWVEYRFEIDLTNNQLTTYYDGQRLSQGQYAIGANDPVEYENLDLYSAGGTCFFDDVSFRKCGTFSNYGNGLAGTGGIIPTITGGNCPNVGYPFTVTIGAGLANTQGALLFGTSQVSFGLFGGTILVVPSISVNYALNGSGEKTFTFGVPPDNNLVNANVYLQGLNLDAGAVQGISFTNGLKVTVDQ
jgi:hypothetical protein